jgi:uridylate kinase
LISKEELNIDFLKKFRQIILKEIARGKRFIIICGGGKTARRYQNAAKEIIKLDDEDLDWLGIHATRINAHLIRTIFRDYSEKKIVKNPTEKIIFKEKVLVASGWKPGCSTDYDAVLIAENFGIKKLVNLSNIDCVCDKDPKMHKDARKIEQISWKEFRKLLPEKWSPGLNAPFDPIAAKLAEKLKIEVAVINGENLENLENYFNDKKFIGTIIK